MPTQLETIMDRLELLWKSMPITIDGDGIAQVTVNQPRTMPRLPAAILTAGRASYNKLNTGESSVTRDVSMFYVVSSAKGELQGQAEARLTGQLDTIFEYFEARDRLQTETLPGVVTSSRVVNDSGVQTYNYPNGSDNFYVGVIFNLQIVYLKLIQDF